MLKKSCFTLDNQSCYKYYTFFMYVMRNYFKNEILNSNEKNRLTNRYAYFELPSYLLSLFFPTQHTISTFENHHKQT